MGEAECFIPIDHKSKQGGGGGGGLHKLSLDNLSSYAISLKVCIDVTNVLMMCMCLFEQEKYIYCKIRTASNEKKNKSEKNIEVLANRGWQVSCYQFCQQCLSSQF